MGTLHFLGSPQNPEGKSDATYALMKAAVQAAVNAHRAKALIPVDTIILEIRTAKIPGWTDQEITEGLLKQIAQDLHLPHVSI